jgi:S1-C subfamily serine protease
MIEQDLSYRPRVPRETRRLLTAALVALLSIWALARVRFPDRPAAPNPVAPLLSQLAPRMRFEDLASQLAALRPRVAAVLHPVIDGGPTALRVRDGISLALLDVDRAGATAAGTVRAMDRASGLVVIETATATPAPPLMFWSPDRLDQPRYLISAIAGKNEVRLLPVLTAGLASATSPVWPGMIWTLTGDAHIPPGSFVFTEDAQFVGLAWEGDGAVAVIPGATLIAETERLLATEAHRPGWLGVDVSALTPALALATGASAGVVVSWVDGRGPSSGSLMIGDVIETVDGAAVRSPLDWQARERRLTIDGAVRLNVRRQKAVREMTLKAAAPPPRARRVTLGLDLLPVNDGSQVLIVEPGSIAEDAGLRRGDVIVHAGGVNAPSPDELQRLFATSRQGQPLFIAISREGTHHVTTLEKDAPERP